MGLGSVSALENSEASGFRCTINLLELSTAALCVVPRMCRRRTLRGELGPPVTAEWQTNLAPVNQSKLPFHFCSFSTVCKLSQFLFSLSSIQRGMHRAHNFL